MLPPPITMPISTPRRDTCATSATIASIVWRLMPKGSSPIRASPDSLSRILLYFGVKAACRSMRLPRLRFVDAFANDEEGISVDLRLLRPEHLLHRLLIVLDEGLAKQGFLAEEFVHGTFDHFRHDFGRLSGFFGARLLDAPLVTRDFLWNLASSEVSGLGKRDVHGEVLAHLVRSLIVDQHTDLRTMEVKRDLALRLQALEAADADVLADFLHQRVALRFDLAADGVDGYELFHIGRVARSHELSQRAGKRDEIVVLRHKIRFAVELHERADLCVRRKPSADDALGSDATRYLAGLRAALDAQ